MTPIIYRRQLCETHLLLSQSAWEPSARVSFATATRFKPVALTAAASIHPLPI
jgi:hypothetical protein